ncbi:MAG: flavodoxin [Ancrocorticia sp.]
MKALMIIESSFGNVAAAGEAVAVGLRSGGCEVAVVAVGEAPQQVPEGTDLLLVGGPTHNRTLSTSVTRGLAAADGGQPGAVGIRDWLETAQLPEEIRVAAFGTASGRAWVNGSSAKAAAKIIAQRIPELDVETQLFVVAAAKGPLAPGESELAEQWGGELVRAIAGHN